jgi:N-acetyl-gamma-glutamyl-phosphate reductase
MIRASIIGITGYTGEELLKILSRRKDVRITGVYGRETSETKNLKDIYPEFENLNLQVLPLNVRQISETSDVVFLALPHAVAFEVVPALIKANVKVIDLSADFRLKDAAVYETWYKVNHTAKDLINKAVYGLSELYAKQVKQAALVANPGCYPTSILLGLAPALTDGFINTNGITIDSQSGISGAGRKSTEVYFKTEHPAARAYGICGTHRHIPEIEQELSKLGGTDIKVTFTPHIIPLERGMLSTIYADLNKNISSEEITAVYKNFYKDKPFIKILDAAFPSTKNVVTTNFCEITARTDKRTNKLIVVSAIDNLVKGAAGQAVQNMNIMFNLNEAEGLL